MLFDSHNHLQSQKFTDNLDQIICDMKLSGVIGSTINATSEDDWHQIDELHQEHPNYLYPAYGIHPWKADTVSAGWQERLKAKLSANPLTTVGECGLDGWIKSPTLKQQIPIFQSQVEISAEYERIMTVHALKAWEAFFYVMDQAKRWPQKFLMHSFNGSIEIAEKLAKRGAWFSFSGYFLHPKKKKVLEVFRRLPPDRILLETDAPDMRPPMELIDFPLEETLNHPANLRRIAEELENHMFPGFLKQVAANTKLFWDSPKTSSSEKNLKILDLSLTKQAHDFTENPCKTISTLPQ